MKLGIIVYSQTGNTYSVAMKLKDKLVKAGHTVNIERLKPAGEAKPGMKNIRFESIPDIAKYDSLVFGSPVQAFSLSSAMSCYLESIGSLQDKNVSCFVTQAFPFSCLGGNHAVSQMKNSLKIKGAIIRGSGIINWMSKKREQQIDEVTGRLTGLI